PAGSPARTAARQRRRHGEAPPACSRRRSFGSFGKRAGLALLTTSFEPWVPPPTDCTVPASSRHHWSARHHLRAPRSDDMVRLPMRAGVMRNRKLVVADVPIPEPGPGEVLVRTLSCGICGSDLHALRFADAFVESSRLGGNTRVMDLDKDVVMGHEFCAEIVEHGAQTVRGLRSGARLCSRPTLLRPTGPRSIGSSNDNPGGYGEYMRLSEALLLQVPNGLSTVHAALTEPMAVGVHAVAKARLESDDAPLVIGCGPVGLAVIAALRLRGVRPI